MRSQDKRSERIVVLAIVGMLALNYPWLSLFSKNTLVFGIPLLYLYLFGLWALLILLAGLIIENERKKETDTTSRGTMSVNKPDKDDR